MSAEPVPGWASAAGHVTLPAARPGDRALDRMLIAERIARYGWAFDERDRAALADCFAAGGVWQGLVMGRDRVGPFTGPDVIADWLAGFWDTQYDQRRHVFTNVVIEDSGQGQASAHAYLVLFSSYEATTNAISVGPYRFHLRLTDDGLWRITKLEAGFDAPF